MYLGGQTEFRASNCSFSYTGIWHFPCLVRYNKTFMKLSKQNFWKTKTSPIFTRIQLFNIIAPRALLSQPRNISFLFTGLPMKNATSIMTLKLFYWLILTNCVYYNILLTVSKFVIFFRLSKRRLRSQPLWLTLYMSVQNLFIFTLFISAQR